MEAPSADRVESLAVGLVMPHSHEAPSPGERGQRDGCAPLVLSSPVEGLMEVVTDRAGGFVDAKLSPRRNISRRVGGCRML